MITLLTRTRLKRRVVCSATVGDYVMQYLIGVAGPEGIPLITLYVNPITDEQSWQRVALCTNFTTASIMLAVGQALTNSALGVYYDHQGRPLKCWPWFRPTI
jgi:hypothetical protein